MSLMPVTEAMQLILQAASAEPPQPAEQLPLASALNRILAEPLHCAHAVPPWDNSAMDGYALHSADIPQALAAGLPVSQRITAGMAPTPLTAGTCARIFTGAPMPAGADSVEMQENVTLDAAGIAHFIQALKPKQNVRHAGQDITRGAVIMAAGTRLRAQDLGVIASAGIAEVPVRRALRVAIVSTGDELVEPGQPLGPGQIFNSNRYTLMGCLQRMGQTIIDGGILPDDPVQTTARLTSLAEQADVIISSGGVSVGEADYLGLALREQGQLNMWKLAIKPGKPFTLARYAGTPVLGLPGNPAATLVTFLLLVRPYLLRRLGVQHTEPLGFAVPAGFVWSKTGNRDEYLRACLQDGQVVPAGNQSSGVLSSASEATGLLLIPAGTLVDIGQPLSFLPFDGLFQ